MLTNAVRHVRLQLRINVAPVAQAGQRIGNTRVFERFGFRAQFGGHRFECERAFAHLVFERALTRQQQRSAQSHETADQK